jgi:predicted transcriptional regulator
MEKPTPMILIRDPLKRSSVVHIRLEDEVVLALKRLARAEHRAISNYIAKVIKEHLAVRI